MLQKIKLKRDELKSKGNAGFTLMELIIVIAILAMLIGMLLPRFTNYTDKAMGTSAGVDIKNILTIATAYNLDNSTEIAIGDLTTQTGIPTTGTPKSLADATDGKYTYTYTRGGAKVEATIDVRTSEITYKITGADGSTYEVTPGTPPAAATSADQANRIAKGLGF